MSNYQKTLFFFIALIICLISMGCGPENVEVWKAIPCKLNIIDCSSDKSNTIEIRMLNDDGSINDKVQFEQMIIEQNERKTRFKRDTF